MTSAYDERGERNILDGDAQAESHPSPGRSPIVEDPCEYGSRAGPWRRLSGLFEVRGLPYTCARDIPAVHATEFAAAAIVGRLSARLFSASA